MILTSLITLEWIEAVRIGSITHIRKSTEVISRAQATWIHMIHRAILADKHSAVDAEVERVQMMIRQKIL
jgi:hypothetical protein